MQSISMKQTAEQFVDGSKDVTRRIGWKFARVGMRLRVVRQAMGLKKHTRYATLGYIELVSVRSEPLSLMISDRLYGTAECIREGFPKWTPEQFVRFFCETHAVRPSAVVQRLEFKRIAIDDGKRELKEAAE